MFGAYDERPSFRYLLSPRNGWSYVRGKTVFMPESQITNALDEQGILAMRVYAYLAHELAHLWWGGAVQPAGEEAYPNSEWLSEGFAEFSKMVAVETCFSPDAACQVRRSWAKNTIKHESSPPVVAATQKRCEDWYQWRDLTYYKSALVLSMMRDEMGDEVFFSMMKAWVTDNRGSAVTTTKFLENMAAHFDESDRFAKQWLLGSETPTVSVSYRTEKSPDGFEVSGFVRQEGTVFDFPLEMLVRGDDDSKLIRLRCAERSTLFRSDVDFEPARLEVDPSHRILLRCTAVDASPRRDG